MKPGAKRFIGAVVVASVCGAALVQAQGPRRRMDDESGRCAALVLGEERRPPHEGRRAEGRAEVPVEAEARQRVAPAELTDDTGPDGPADLAPRIQGPRVRRCERRARLRGRYRPGARVLDDGHQLLVDHAARQQHLGVSWRIDGRRDAADDRLRSRRSVVAGAAGAAADREARSASRERARRAWRSSPRRAGAWRGAERSGARGGAAPAAPARGAPPAGRGGGGGLGGGPTDNIFVVASDGYARTINPHNGSDRVPPVPFLPANARPPALIAVDGVLYTSTSNGCGAAPNGVWALDLASDAKTPVSWKTNGGNVAGTAGLTFGTDGTIFVAVGDAAAAAAAPGRPRTRTRSWRSSRRR